MDLAGIWAVIAATSAGFLGGTTAGFIAGGVVAFFRERGLESRLDSMEARVQRFHNVMISEAGVDGRAEKAQRAQEAINRALELASTEEFKTDGKPDMGKVGLQVLKEYPDVALDQVKKAMQGKGVVKQLGGLGAWLK